MKPISVLSAIVLLAAPALRAQTNPLGLTYHHTTASVADLEKEADWYEHVLGFTKSKRISDSPDFAMYQMTMPGNRIDLVWQRASARHRSGKGRMEQGWLHVVFRSADLDAADRYLEKQGVAVVQDRDASGKVVHLTINDPEGNEIGIVSAPPM
jgi:catechol 2,3-dioxygenase-like lactoylglutathione lyase family enzyme